ncbi:MAG: phosphoribosylglycinamide formyltransferase [Deltaproteobacteria bacterium]|nr:phosphoribosylglycinamide formyltransferase [Deltaproteobacteria bacterium]
MPTTHDDPSVPGRPLRVAVLLSGGGTSLENLLEHIDAGRVSAEVVLVISSKERAFGLERARRRGIPAVAISRKKLGDSARFNDALHAELAKHDVDLIALLGFLSLFELRGRYEGRVINVHPALIPAFCGHGFYGDRVHQAVLAAGVKVSGATVHFSNDEYDRGPIILQEAVPVLESDTLERLKARVMAAERRIVPEAIRLIAEGRVQVKDGRTWISR